MLSNCTTISFNINVKVYDLRSDLNHFPKALVKIKNKVIDFSRIQRYCKADTIVCGMLT